MTSTRTVGGPSSSRSSRDQRMAELAGDRYSCPAARRLHGPPRADAAACPHRRQSGPRGILPNRSTSKCSHDRLAAFDLQASKIKDVLSARNVTAPGGIVRPRAGTSASMRPPSSGPRRRLATCWLAPRRPECRCTCAISCDLARLREPDAVLNHLTLSTPRAVAATARSRSPCRCGRENRSTALATLLIRRSPASARSSRPTS